MTELQYQAFFSVIVADLVKTILSVILMNT